MKAKKKFYVAIALVILIVILLIGYLFYIPPLLDDRGYNLPGWIYNFFAYAYYSSRMDWLENQDESPARRCTAARAAWYNPSQLQRLLGISPADSYGLAREYARLGLRRQARVLFMKAVPAALKDENRIEDIIAYQMTLEDWKGAETAAALWLEKYPGSAPAAYWYGRALVRGGEYIRSLPMLKKAREDEKYLPDALYWAGRSCQFSGRIAESIAFQEEVIRIVPGHRGAWSALAEMYGQDGDEAARGAAKERLDILTPRNLSRKIFGNELVLLGYDLSESGIKPGGMIKLTLYLEGWRPNPAKVIPRLTLDSEGNPGSFSFQGEAVDIRTAGEVVREELSWRLPRAIYPGSVNFSLSFSGPDKTVNLPLPGEPSDRLFLLARDISPHWMESQIDERLVLEKFGSAARPLGRSIFLGPGDAAEMAVEESKPVAGIGLISYSQASFTIGRGMLLANITVRTGGGQELVFPIRSGEETGEVWWEFIEPHRRKYPLPPVFRSWASTSGERQFQAYEYYACYDITPPLNLVSIKIENTGINGGFYVTDVVFILD
jgi:tetratricopeptide (TPR) repeat protein